MTTPRCECGGRMIFRFATQEFECLACGRTQLVQCVIEIPDPVASNFVPDGDNYSENSFP